MQDIALNAPKLFDLIGNVALVTGAGSGIGAASARYLAREGARVVCTDLDEARGQAVGTLFELPKRVAPVAMHHRELVGVDVGAPAQEADGVEVGAVDLGGLRHSIPPWAVSAAEDRPSPPAPSPW